MLIIFFTVAGLWEPLESAQRLASLDEHIYRPHPTFQVWNDSRTGSAARAWLNWTQVELAKQSKTALSTVQDFEAGLRDTQPRNRATIQAALERRGIRFVNGKRGSGITFVKASTKTRARTGMTAEY